MRGVSFTIERGETFGLLGPNGAGKTTTIKMLITLLLPTSGSASVLGFDVVDDVREVRRRIGYVFGGDRGLYDRLSGLDNLRYFAELYGVAPREQKAADRRAAGAGGADRAREGAGGGLLPRHAPAPAHRARPAARPGRALPRRAVDRDRPGRRPRAARDDRRARGPGQDRPADHALHVRGRRALRPDRGDPRRARSSPRARPASSSSGSPPVASSRWRPTACPRPWSTGWRS